MRDIDGARRIRRRPLTISTLGAWSLLCALSLLAASTFLGARGAAADPAASPQSAWARLPAHEPGTKLKNRLERRGRDVFRERCAACHGPIPKKMIGPPYLPAMPGTQALKARYKGAEPAELEKRTDLTAALIRGVVRGGLNSMPFFRPTELSDDDLNALVAYLTRKRR